MKKKQTYPNRPLKLRTSRTILTKTSNPNIKLSWVDNHLKQRLEVSHQVCSRRTRTKKWTYKIIIWFKRDYRPLNLKIKCFKLSNITISWRITTLNRNNSRISLTNIHQPHWMCNNSKDQALYLIRDPRPQLNRTLASRQTILALNKVRTILASLLRISNLI